MTKLEIFNKALAQHGKKCTQEELDSSNPPTDVEACQRMYDQAIEDVLAEHDWSFCVVPIELDYEDDEPYGLYRHGYRMPANIIRVARKSSENKYPFFISGGRLYTSEEKPQLWGVLMSSIIMDVAPRDFCNLVALWLGFLVATIISPGDSNLTQRILQNYSAHLQAMMKRELNSVNDNYLDEDDWSRKQI